MPTFSWQSMRLLPTLLMSRSALNNKRLHVAWYASEHTPELGIICRVAPVAPLLFLPLSCVKESCCIHLNFLSPFEWCVRRWSSERLRTLLKFGTLQSLKPIILELDRICSIAGVSITKEGATGPSQIRDALVPVALRSTCRTRHGSLMHMQSGRLTVLGPSREIWLGLRLSPRPRTHQIFLYFGPGDCFPALVSRFYLSYPGQGLNCLLFVGRYKELPSYSKIKVISHQNKNDKQKKLIIMSTFCRNNQWNISL